MTTGEIGANLSKKGPRVLVTGAGGVLGGRLAALLAREMDVVAAVHHSPVPEGLARVPLDLLEPASYAVALELARPDAVVHAAAMASPDAAEAAPERATRLNAKAPRLLARMCAGRGLRLVALSTDLVLPGDRALSDEDAPPGPLLHYARTKLEGEQAVLGEHPGAAVVRVALVVGRGHGARGTASESVAWALRRGQRVRLFSDQYRTPVDAESVAQAVAALLRGTQQGLFHLGGDERVSRYEMGRRLAAVQGLDAALIDEARQAEQGVPRPADVSLDSARARRELGFAPRPLDTALREGRPDPPWGSGGEAAKPR